MTARTDAPDAATDGLWRRNWPLVQLVGLTPLLAVTTSAVQGVALGIATLIVLVVANTVLSLVRPVLVPRIRVPVYVAIATVTVTCLDWLTHATFYGLHAALGVFLPLVVANGGLMREAEAAATRSSFRESVVSAIATGLGFLAVLLALGTLRELVGTGALFADLDLLGAERGRWLPVSLPFDGVHIALLPPGAFFGVAALLALHNRLGSRSGTERRR